MAESVLLSKKLLFDAYQGKNRHPLFRKQLFCKSHHHTRRIIRGTTRTPKARSGRRSLCRLAKVGIINATNKNARKEHPPAEPGRLLGIDQWE